MLDDIRITTKITAILFIMALSGALLMGFMSWQMVRIDDAYSDQVERRDVATLGAARTNRLLVNYGWAANRLAMEFTPEGIRELKAELLLVKSQLSQEWSDVRRQLPEDTELLDGAYTYPLKAFAACEDPIDEAARTATPQEVVKAGMRLKAECDPALVIAIAKMSEATNVLVKIAKDNSNDLTARTWQAVRLSAWLMGLGLIVALALGVVLGLRGIIAPLQRLNDVARAFGKKQFDQTTPGTDRKDELGALARAIEVMRLEAINMETQSWLKKHVADIGSALQQASDMAVLAQTVVSRVAPVIGAGHAVFYVAGPAQRFQLLGSYGYRDRKQLSNSFAIGEGLVGQVAMEKMPITLTAPQDYIRIGSGLGEGPPACVSVIPFIMGERVLGVLEVASFQRFTQREIDLLDALQPVVASTLEILDRNLTTQALFTSTQEQAERMEKQAAQLEEQTVEMEAQQAELLETENWFRNIIETAPEGLLVADAKGRILLTNPKAEHIFGYEAGELVGGQIQLLMPGVLHNAHLGDQAQRNASGEPGHAGSGQTLALTGVAKDGKEMAVLANLSPMPEHGNRGKCVSVSVRKA